LSASDSVLRPYRADPAADFAGLSSRFADNLLQRRISLEMPRRSIHIPLISGGRIRRNHRRHPRRMER